MIIILGKQLNCSVSPIDGTLTGTTAPGQSKAESNDNQGVLHISKASELEPHHHMQFNVIR